MARKEFAEVKSIGNDDARVDWIVRTWRKRGVIFEHPQEEALRRLDEIGRDRVDTRMSTLRVD